MEAEIAKEIIRKLIHNTKWEYLSPEECGRMFQTKIHPSVLSQRKFRQNWAEDMRSRLINDTWHINHEAIGIDEDGWVIDGQHRLWAGWKSGKGLYILIVREIPVKQVRGYSTAQFIDMGHTRSVATQLGIGGFEDTKFRAALARAVQLIACRNHAHPNSLEVSKYVFAKYAEDITEVLKYRVKQGRFQSGHIYGTLAVCHHAFPDEMKPLIKGFLQGIALEEGSAAHKLHMYFASGNHYAGVAGGNAISEKIQHAICYASMKHILGEPFRNVITASSSASEFFREKQEDTMNKLALLSGVGLREEELPLVA